MENLILPGLLLGAALLISWAAKKSQRNEDSHKAADKAKRGW